MRTRRGLSGLGLVIIMVMIFATIGYSGAVTLDLGDAIAASGGAVEIAISLDSGGGAVAGTSNDISYDPAVFTNPRARIDSSIGMESEVDKQVISNVVKDGVLRVAVLGLNREVIPDGVVAWVSFDVAEDAASGRTLTLKNKPSASDADGNSLATSGTDGRVYVTALGGGSAPAAVSADATPVSITISPSSGVLNGPINLAIKVSEAESIENFMENGFSVFLNGEDITSFLVGSGAVTIDGGKGEATLIVEGLALPEGEYTINAYLGNLSGFIGHTSVKYDVVLSD